MTGTPDSHESGATPDSDLQRPSPTSVAIVGAGAMGVVTGYHLHLAGADVTFVVRPSRLNDTPSSYALYSYDDGSLKAFSSFTAVPGPKALENNAPDFVILTPDGATLASEAGRAMLRELGAALRDKQTTLIVGAVGIGIRDLVIAETSLPGNRVIAGLFAMLAHKVEGFDLPIHPPTDAATLAQADFAYRHLNEGGFLLETRNARAAEQFVQLYDQCGIAKCFTTSPEHFALMIHESAPINLLVGLGRAPDEVAAEDPDLWALTVDAMRAIRRLSEHGDAGKDALKSDAVLEGQKALEQAALPLDYTAFNARHHGAKVRAADVAMLEGCIARGENESRDMASARQLLDVIGY